MRHQQDHLFSRARDQGNHDDGERDRARERREAVERLDEDCVYEDADDDRRYAHHHIGGKPDYLGELTAAILGEVNARPYSNRHADQGSDSTSSKVPMIALAIPPPFWPTGVGILVKSPVDAGGAFAHQVTEHKEERYQRNHRGENGQANHEIALEIAEKIVSPLRRFIEHHLPLAKRRWVVP